MRDSPGGSVPLQTRQQEAATKGGKATPGRKGRSRGRNALSSSILVPGGEPDMEPGWSTPWDCLPRRGTKPPRRAPLHSRHGKTARRTGIPARGHQDDGATGGHPPLPQTANSPRPRGTPQSRQQQSRRRTGRFNHGKPWTSKRPPSWSNHKRVATSLARDVTSVELWDEEVEKEEQLAIQTKPEDTESEDWDAPEAQTDPGNGLTWDEMIPRDHGVAPTWVERQEQERIDRSLPWRSDPEGSIWQRDPSPRWRIREEWALSLIHI